METEWTLRELAAETGVPERTIRYYISRDLMPPPLRGGRGAAYGPHHKARLEEIKKLQAKGTMLVDIAHSFALHHHESAVTDISQADGPAGLSLPEPHVWKSYRIDDDVVVLLRVGISPWRTKHLDSGIRRFMAMIKEVPIKENDGE